MGSEGSALRAAPAIAPPPRRIRSSSDILRLLPYLKPYKVRWTVMLIAAFVSLGATVAVTAGSAEKLERCRELGADILINYREDAEWGKTARKLNGGRGVDLVVEVGGAAGLDE